MLYPRPPVMFHYFDTRLFYKQVAIGEVQFADCNNGRVMVFIAIYRAGFIAIFGFSGDVYTGDICLTRLRLVSPGVASRKLCLLLPVEKAAAAADSLKAVLGQEEGVIFAQPLPFRFYISQIGVIIFGNYILDTTNNICYNGCIK